ncbi:LytR C-terminal domain-containing protein [Cellulomonas sp. HZM]|uniref:LytR C-terminal domain-containing protein n=1 Tax=Cellulomonas sp. HZM TaxID=1454010 RepID=UPI0006901BB8|nr:LytR C-terminal domain-containing protein [Cellulomonas sp. HZM]
MSKADYPYADDEFDAPRGPDVPRGVHRAPRSAWSRWWPFLVVLVVVPALAYALVTWASRDRSTDDSSSPEPDVTQTETTKATDDATPPATSEPPESPSQGPTSDESTGDATPEVDFATPVVIQNAAGVKGLAARTAAEVTAAGFSKVVAENFSGAKPSESTVYYSSSDQQATAQAVADAIGVDAVTLSESDAGDGITVVLVTDPKA